MLLLVVDQLLFLDPSLEFVAGLTLVACLDPQALVGHQYQSLGLQREVNQATRLIAVLGTERLAQSSPVVMKSPSEFQRSPKLIPGKTKH